MMVTHKYLATDYELIRMKYRSRTDIVGLILEGANGGLREYLAMLLENGLIEYEEGRQTYRTTEKGIRLLQIYNHMSDELVISNK